MVQIHGSRSIDEYEVETGGIVPNHIVDIFATSVAVGVPGRLLDPDTFIRETANLHQRLDARKYYGPRPASSRPRNEPPVMIVSECGLFAHPETEQDRATRTAAEAFAALGIQLD